MHELPIDDVLADIISTLKNHNRVVLQASPGAGKTTKVPIALLESLSSQSWFKNKQIIMLEPRRIAARNAASRMAYLLNEKVGLTVGYQIRDDNCYSKKTQILVVTEGILTRKLQADPELSTMAFVIFDEFHERSLHADLSLALCLQSQQVLREDLKILVMSATLNTSAISSLLDKAPIIQSEGRSFPVDIRYIEKSLNQTGDAFMRHQNLILKLLEIIKRVINEEKGHCLVFLPGLKEITQLQFKLEEMCDLQSINNILITPLHGQLSKQQQDLAIKPTENPFRKIVLATNIAETSLTIEGVDCVIDSGLERILEYNPSSAMDSLKTQFISRLWTKQQQQRLLKHSAAEILHSDLSTLVLELANWGVLNIDELKWMDKPPNSAINQAKALLTLLKAIDDKGRITQHGQLLLKLGTHPRIAHMILSAAALQQAYSACLIAAILTEKDFYYARADKTADIQDRLKILNEFSENNAFDKRVHHGVDLSQCKRIIKSANDFYKRLKRCSIKSVQNDLNLSLSGVLLAYAYPDRIAKQRNPNASQYFLSNGKGAMIPEYLYLNLYEYLVVPSLDEKSLMQSKGEAVIYLFADITVQQLEEYFVDLIVPKESVVWNDIQQRVEVKQTLNIGKLVLKETFTSPSDKSAVHECLIQAIKKNGLMCLTWSAQANNFKQRVSFINKNIQNNNNLKLPDFSDAILLNSLTVKKLIYINYWKISLVGIKNS